MENPTLLLGDLSNGIEIAEITMMVCLASRCFDFAEHGPFPFNRPCADQVGCDRCCQGSREGSCADKSRHAGHGQPRCQKFCKRICDRNIIHLHSRERVVCTLAMEDNQESIAQTNDMSARKNLRNGFKNRSD